MAEGGKLLGMAEGGRDVVASGFAVRIGGLRKGLKVGTVVGEVVGVELGEFVGSPVGDNDI